MDPDDPDAKAAVHDLTAGLGADISVETVGGFGDVATFVQAVDLTRVRGRIVVLGAFHDPTMTDWMQLHLKEQTLIFSVCYGLMDGRHDFEMAVDLMASGRVDLKRMVTPQISAHGDSASLRYRLRQVHRFGQGTVAHVSEAPFAGSRCRMSPVNFLEAAVVLERRAPPLPGRRERERSFS